jgi:hypothetical protein
VDKEKEKCVLCGKETEYLKGTPVDQRLHYIEGSGQLCARCYVEIYGYDTCGCSECREVLVR